MPCGSLRADLASEHPLLWFSKDRPSTDIHTSRPVQSPPERGFLGLMLPSIRHLPSLSFLPTSTVYSANCSAGLLHPAASHGVRAVSSWASLPLCHHISRSSRPFPSSLLTPFEAFPSLKAVPRHRGRCHPAVASSHCFQCVSAQPHGFTPSSSPLSATGVSTDDPLVAPLGFVPLQGAPLVPTAHLDSPGVRPPQRSHSGPRPPRCSRPGRCLHECARVARISVPVPASGSPRGAFSDSMARRLCCRPADRGQPAIELSESTSRVLCPPFGQFRRNPTVLLHGLQRSSRFEVALASRVSSFRAQGLKACAKAIVVMSTEVSLINDRFAMTH